MIKLISQKPSIRMLGKEQRVFLDQLIETMIEIGGLKREEAEKLLRSSGIIKLMHRRDSMIMHEPPSYYAFSLAYRGSDDWVKAYQNYIMKIKTRENIF